MKFNWCTQVNKIFFENIGFENGIEYFTANKLENSRDLLIEKLKEIYFRKDLEKSRTSTSLYFSSELEYDRFGLNYFTIINNMELLRVVSQIPLSNKFNKRLIIKNRIYKCKENTSCVYCCTTNNIVHKINIII